MTELIDWLRAQLDADTAEIAKHPDGEDEWMMTGFLATEEGNYPCSPYLRISKERALAEVDAKRRIVALHDSDHECSVYDHHGDVDNCSWVIGGGCSTVKLLALPYADRPGYRDEWRP